MGDATRIAEEQDNRSSGVVMQIELTQAEHGLLVTLLQERQRELLREIARADHHDFRHTLQEREGMLEALLHKLNAGTVTSSAA